MNPIQTEADAMATRQLIDYIQRMIGIIRYENQYAYRMLLRVTANKCAVIRIDDCTVNLEAGENDSFILLPGEAKTDAALTFSAGTATLQRIIAGNLTIDKAIMDHEIFIRAPFQDLLGMYRLTTCLLAEGPLNPALRELWQMFIIAWCPVLACCITTIEQQKPRYDYLIGNIPQNALRVKW